MQKIDAENRRMRDKLESTNGSIGSFISDMNSLLDTNELQSILNMEMDSDLDDEHDLANAFVRSGPTGDPSELRPHAGTGGSSKLKSRPNQQ